MQKKSASLIALVFAAFIAGAPLTSSAARLNKDDVRVLDEYQIRFMKAIERNRADIVHELLANGLSPNLLVEEGDPALVRAIRLQNKDVIKELLACPKLDLNMSSIYGETALMLAAFSGDIDLVKALLAKGAQFQTTLGWSALHYAATNGHEAIVKLLIEKGANVNVRTSAGITPLYMAARSKHRKVVMQLLRSGAYRDLCNTKQQSPADAARSAGDEELAKYLAIDRCIEPKDSPFKIKVESAKP